MSTSRPDSGLPLSRRERRVLKEQATETSKADIPGHPVATGTDPHNPAASPDIAAKPRPVAPAPRVAASEIIDPTPTPPISPISPISPKTVVVAELPATEPQRLRRSHLLGIVAGLLLTPAALLLTTVGAATLLGGADSQPLATHSSLPLQIFIGLGSITAGAVLLGLLALISGRRSSLGLAVGSLWPLIIAVLGVPLYQWISPANVVYMAGYSPIDLVLHDLALLIPTGLYPMTAIIMMVSAASAGTAYHGGRAFATIEAAHRASPFQLIRRQQLVSLGVAILSAVLLATGMLAMIPLNNRISVAASGSNHSSLPLVLQLSLPVLGILLLFGMSLLVSRSCLGMPAAGLLVGAIPGLALTGAGIVAPQVTDQWITWLNLQLGTSMQIAGSPLVALGALTMACGFCACAARRAGYHDQCQLLEDLTSEAN